jgi:hypothetical protein
MDFIFKGMPGFMPQPISNAEGLSMARPTEEAEKHLSRAREEFLRVFTTEKPGTNDYYLSLGLMFMSEALAEISVGLRATYMLLEQTTGRAR